MGTIDGSISAWSVIFKRQIDLTTGDVARLTDSQQISEGVMDSEGKATFVIVKCVHNSDPYDPDVTVQMPDGFSLTAPIMPYCAICPKGHIFNIPSYGESPGIFFSFPIYIFSYNFI